MQIKLEQKVVNYRHWGKPLARTRLVFEIDGERVGSLLLSQSQADSLTFLINLGLAVAKDPNAGKQT